MWERRRRRCEGLGASVLLAFMRATQSRSLAHGCPALGIAGRVTGSGVRAARPLAPAPVPSTCPACPACPTACPAAGHLLSCCRRQRMTETSTTLEFFVLRKDGAHGQYGQYGQKNKQCVEGNGGCAACLPPMTDGSVVVSARHCARLRMILASLALIWL